MIVVSGTAGGDIGRNIAKILKAKYFNVEKKEFPDGEFVVKVPADVKDDDVVIVQSTYSPQDRHIMEILFIADALSVMGVRSIWVVVPYLAYMRQDKRFLHGQVVSSHVVMKLLNTTGIHRLITVQPHKEKPLAAFKGEVDTVYPIKTLIKAVAEDVTDPYVLAPDIGGLELAKSAAEALKCEYAHIDKERDPVTGIAKIKNTPDQRFDGKQVIIVDDMISSGGTIILAAKFAYSRGATEVVAAAVHLVMSNNAYHKLRQAGVTKVYGTNTIPFDKAKVVDISKDIADALKNKKQDRLIS